MLLFERFFCPCRHKTTANNTKRGKQVGQWLVVVITTANRINRKGDWERNRNRNGNGDENGDGTRTGTGTRMGKGEFYQKHPYTGKALRYHSHLNQNSGCLRRL